MFTLKDNDALNALKEQMLESKEKVKGVLKTTYQGFGFLVRETGSDAFVPKELMLGLLPESEVLVYIDSSEKGEFVTEILEVTKQGNLEYFCKIDVFPVEDREYVNAKTLRGDLDIKIQLGQKKFLNVENGDIVLVKISDFTSKPVRFKGSVLFSLGNESDPKTIWRLIKSEFNLNEKLDEMPVLKLPLMESKQDWIDNKGYQDWTDKPFVTIDSYSSNDLDDALYMEDAGDEWLLHIAIANPTLLLEDNDKLRKFILKRGVTHYLANEIIHLMLQSYSENYFSLLEGKLRPAMGAVIPINKNTGDLGKANFSMVMITSRAKLTYDQVSEHIKQRFVDVIDDDPVIAKSLNLLHEMSQKRLDWRTKNGFIGVDNEDYFIVLEDDVPVAVREVVKKVSHSMVEESAIAANIAFTEWAEERSLPIIYVTHSGFDPDKEVNLRQYLLSRGVPFEDGHSLIQLFDTSHSYLSEQFSIAMKGDDAYLIALAKRDLTELRAFYLKGEISLKKRPHLPMGLSGYATWTSPIRKSLDMEHHLIAKGFLENKAVTPPSEEDVSTIQERIRTSRQAERRLNRLLGLTYMKGKLGNVVSVKVTGVLKKAIRVEVAGVGISATLSFRELKFKGYVELDNVKQVIKVDNKIHLKLGDVFDVEVKKVSPYEGELILVRDAELEVIPSESCDAEEEA
jgi:exoribonuclease-2